MVKQLTVSRGECWRMPSTQLPCFMVLEMVSGWLSVVIRALQLWHWKCLNRFIDCESISGAFYKEMEPCSIVNIDIDRCQSWRSHAVVMCPEVGRSEAPPASHSQPRLTFRPPSSSSPAIPGPWSGHAVAAGLWRTSHHLSSTSCLMCQLFQCLDYFNFRLAAARPLLWTEQWWRPR